MDKQFTASEVRDLSRRMAVSLVEMDARPPKDEHVMAALDAFADRLEADEKAVPVGCLTVQRFRGSDAMVNHDFDYYGSLPDGSYSLYTQSQSAPSDAERLAEALRNMLDVVDPAHWPTYVRDAKKALAAHSAQAQPPAASVTEALRLLQSVLCDADGNCCIRGTYEDRRTVDKALDMLAAQENPNG